jgi:16S rRNA (cytosine967-C5)-methyltransferase
MSTVVEFASAIVGKADRAHPADAVLREKLKGAKNLPRQEGRLISQAVFAYYRWLGWLDRKEPIAMQVRRAVELNERFQKKPGEISDQELQRAIPDWVKDCVEVSPAWLRSLQTEPGLWLRARPGRGDALAAKLGDCQPAFPGALSDALRYEGETDLFRTPEFHAGEFELQDISSQMVGLACQPKPGETWWDACAGEGGKTLHLGDLMQNKGLIWASDRAAWRLQKLKRRTARAKMFNYRAVLWNEGAKLPTKTRFDGILVDAPCSGIGTWQRNPHARWTTTPEDVRELGEVQRQLLASVIPALKPGGRLIYSVCTLAAAETRQVAEAISGQFPELKPLNFINLLEPKSPATEELWLWPQTVAGNGMFICGWQKEGPGCV